MSGPRAVSVVLVGLGMAVGAATLSWPPGTQGVPGPALVPRILAAALVIVGLLIYRVPGTGAPPWVRHHVAVPATMGLLAAYALLWRAIPHGHGGLTGAVLIAFLRLTGLPWRSSLVAGVLMATVLQLLFERGLGVRF